MPRSAVLMIALSAMMFAFLFYTIGIASGFFTRKKPLKIWQVVLLWLGLVCDITSTSLMFTLRDTSNFLAILDWHTIVGLLAILLMAINASVATKIYRSKNVEKWHLLRKLIF